jgi:hypothetical protein
MHEEDDDEQGRTWERLYESVRGLLAQYGTEEATGRADYLIVDDNYGWQRIQVIAQGLKMFRPEIVAQLRALLAELPGWEITMAVDVIGKEKAWPRMGLTIRKHEIIDGLQRQFMPELANVYYQGGRPGTGND